jgi:hypothetical protein
MLLANFPYAVTQTNMQDILNSDKRNTTLTAWFELNNGDLSAYRYFYHEIPIYYVWNKKNRVCSVRQKRS